MSVWTVKSQKIWDLELFSLSIVCLSIPCIYFGILSRLFLPSSSLGYGYKNNEFLYTKYFNWIWSFIVNNIVNDYQVATFVSHSIISPFCIYFITCLNISGGTVGSSLSSFIFCGLLVYVFHGNHISKRNAKGSKQAI